MGIARNITERKRMVRAIQESEQRLRFALESSHTGGWDLNLENKAAHRTLEQAGTNNDWEIINNLQFKLEPYNGALEKVRRSTIKLI